MLGRHPVGSRPLGALRRRYAGLAPSVAVVAGIGTITGVFRATGTLVAVTAGVASVLATGRAVTPMVATSAGIGAANGVMRAFTSSIAMSAGTANAGAVSYTFFSDTERAAVWQEIRLVELQAELRTAFVPQRISVEVDREDRLAHTYNRRRVP